jgi:ubiquinone biosynthesis protein UbiJ
MAGRSLALHVRELDLTLYLLPARHGVQLADAFDDEPDVRLSGSLGGFARSLFAGEDALLSGGDLRVEGDVGLAQGFARLLRGADSDWLDWLAHYIGDVPAELLGRTARGAGDLARRAASTLSRDAAEYLREEARDLIQREELDGFVRGVERLRADAERLSARVGRVDVEEGRS